MFQRLISNTIPDTIADSAVVSDCAIGILYVPYPVRTAVSRIYMHMIYISAVAYMWTDMDLS